MSNICTKGDLMIYSLSDMKPKLVRTIKISDGVIIPCAVETEITECEPDDFQSFLNGMDTVEDMHQYLWRIEFAKKQSKSQKQKFRMKSKPKKTYRSKARRS